jgi:hypothetical protein
VTKDNPEYDLGEIQYLIEERQRGITDTVRTTAHKIGFSETDIYNEILALNKSNFLHSVEGERDHKYQDVYTKIIRNVPVYIKFKKIGKYGDRVLVLSFKKDTSIQ